MKLYSVFTSIMCFGLFFLVACGDDSEGNGLEGVYSFSEVDIMDWRVCLVEDHQCGENITNQPGLNEVWMIDTWVSFFDTSATLSLGIKTMKFELLEGDSLKVTAPEGTTPPDTTVSYELSGDRIYVSDDFLGLQVDNGSLRLCGQLSVAHTQSGISGVDFNSCNSIPETLEEQFARVSRSYFAVDNDTVAMGQTDYVFRKM